MKTIQATQISDALRGIGLRARATKRDLGWIDGKRVRVTETYADFSVRTRGSGSSRNGFGSAYASFKSREAQETALAHAEELVAAGLNVVAYRAADGRLMTVAVNTGEPLFLTVVWGEQTPRKGEAKVDTAADDVDMTTKDTTPKETPSMTITATVEPKGSKFVHRVYVDGVERESSRRTSAHRYGYVHVQRWEGDIAPDKWAARFSRKPGKIGARIEYGYCAESIEILDATAPSATAETITGGQTLQATTIYGPNLNTAAQAKATFHVHAAGCAHGKFYGPGKKFGGEDNGWTIEVADAVEVVQAVYSDALAESPGTDPADWLGDFHFAPCTKALPADTREASTTSDTPPASRQEGNSNEGDTDMSTTETKTPAVLYAELKKSAKAAGLKVVDTKGKWFRVQTKAGKTLAYVNVPGKKGTIRVDLTGGGEKARVNVSDDSTAAEALASMTFRNEQLAEAAAE